jgi:hypothetical protein
MVRIVRISKEEARRRLGDVPDDKRFWCHDGKVVTNLKELKEALDGMSDETFRYHLTGGRNDFGKWVREVVGDEELANDLSKAESRIEAGRAVVHRVSLLGRRV